MMAASDEADARIRARLEERTAERPADPPVAAGAGVMPRDCWVSTRSRCLTSTLYPTLDTLPGVLDLSVEEVAGDSGRQERTQVEIGLSGTGVRNADGGARFTTASPLRLLMPPEALPALARALEHACLSAARCRLFARLRPTTALSTMLPLLTLDTLTSIAHELGTARVREEGDGAEYVLNSMLVGEMGAASPRDAVLESLVRALGNWPGAEAAD